MEISVGFTDETFSRPGYIEESSVLGRVFIPEDSVVITGPVRVRYEKYPWIEKFETDGLKAAPAKRTGCGTKDARGFVKSLSTIYSGAYDDYRSFGGDEGFDAEGYFGHVTEHFAELARDGRAAKLAEKFCGFTENMWREGNEKMYHIAMAVMLPGIMADDDLRRIFDENITPEFREYLDNMNK